MSKKKPSVYIVILNYKNYQDTVNCLESLRSSDYDELGIVVVDNDSQNQSLEQIAEALGEWGEAYELLPEPPAGKVGGAKHLLVQSGANRGYAAGNNVGIRLALENGADYIMILNNDTIVPRDFPGKLVAFAEADPLVGIVGPKVIERAGNVGPSCARRRMQFWDQFFVFGLGGSLFRNNPLRRSYFYKNIYNYEKPLKVDLVSGCCMLIRAEVFRKIGLLDESTFLMCEEMILAEKLRATKYATFIYPEATIHHFHGQSRKLESARWLRKVSNESLVYYLTEYRGYRPSVARLATILRWRPLPRFKN